MYKHTQFGLVTLASLVVSGIVAGYVVYDLQDWAGVAVSATILFIVLLFASLTIVVDSEAVRLRFGIGLIRKTFKLSDIESVRVVRNSWLYGWGIRYTPHGWLYNVSGLGAVELLRRDGKKTRIGSDEPEKLAEAISSAMIEDR